MHCNIYIDLWFAYFYKGAKRIYSMTLKPSRGEIPQSFSEQHEINEK